MAGDCDLSMVQENIEEFINDENRVVTCKWLSLTLNLNINVAKRALYTYVEHSRQKKEKSAIHVTYFVAGLGRSKTGEQEHKCVVVPESELDTVRKSLSTVTTCHLYSVQATKLKDYTPLYQTDYDIIRQNLDQCSSHSSIKCSWVAQKAERPIMKPSSCEKSDNNEPASVSPLVASILTSSSAAKTAKKPEPKGSIASMFAAGGQKKGAAVVASAPSKDSDQKTVNKNLTNKNTNNVKPAEKRGGVMAFFNANEVSKKVSPKKNNKMKVKFEEKEKETVKTKKTKLLDSEPDTKRRRRIRTDLFDSSEDEEEEEDVELEEDVKPEPQEEDRESPILLSNGSDADNDVDDDKDISPKNDREEKNGKPPERVENRAATRDVLNSGGRKRKRAMKSVTKQFQDEDGFLVTKKEVVWESESDHSEPEEVIVAVEDPKSKPASLSVKQNHQNVMTNKKAEPKGKLATKKLTSPQKGKQKSIMSFFKKN